MFFLSHCGMNSVSEALYYEVPLVMFPQTNEQKGVAFRVAELGAGVYLEDESKEAIKEVFDNVLNQTEYKASLTLFMPQWVKKTSAFSNTAIWSTNGTIEISA